MNLIIFEKETKEIIMILPVEKAISFNKSVFKDNIDCDFVVDGIDLIEEAEDGKLFFKGWC